MKTESGISDAQRLMFRTMRVQNVNNFNGVRLVDALEDAADKWLAVMMPVDGLWLRDAESGSWHSTMEVFVSCDNEHTQAIDAIMREHGADEVSELTRDEVGKFLGRRFFGPGTDNNPAVIRAWWD